MTAKVKVTAPGLAVCLATHAYQLKYKYPDSEAYGFYMDVRTPAKAMKNSICAPSKAGATNRSSASTGKLIPTIFCEKGCKG